jgi:hypothetical protein
VQKYLLVFFSSIILNLFQEQTIIEEDPKKKYYMAFPALDKNGNSDDYVSKTMPKSLNWSSIINIRSDKRNPIQNNKKLKSKRKRNFGKNYNNVEKCLEGNKIVCPFSIRSWKIRKS